MAIVVDMVSDVPAGDAESEEDDSRLQRKRVGVGGDTSETGRGIRTYFKKTSPITDRLHDRDEHTQLPCFQPGQRCVTRQIVSTAGAAAWLPHSKRCATRMTGE
ncbi:MAG: hypothetical protein KatS3mg056_2902 [Chloroflexus sp.]|nr:MAG: hypothetical protein KatS3mg056_2902 [Chloroflexus sp.]